MPASRSHRWWRARARALACWRWRAKDAAASPCQRRTQLEERRDGCDAPAARTQRTHHRELQSSAPLSGTLRQVVLVRTPQSNFSFPHDVGVAWIVTGCSGAFRNTSIFRLAPRQWSTAPSDVLSEAPPSEPSSHVAMADIMSPLVTPSCTVEQCECVTSAAAAACSAAAAGPYVLCRHALAARISRVEAGDAPRAHAHRGRSTC